MSGIFAIADHDFDIVFSQIKAFEKRVKINDIQTNVILVSDKKFLIKNFKNIQDNLIKKTVFVFGSPTYLKEFNIPFIDANKKLTSAILKRCIANAKLTELVYKPKDEVKKLLKKSKVSTIQSIQTTLYKIQNKNLREIYKNAIFKYLSGDKDDIKFLENSLILLSKKKSANLLELVEIINSELFRETHLVAMGQSSNSKISKFDVNYILSFKNKVGNI